MTDAKELAEHLMLVDLARNDVARVSRPGTRNVSRPRFCTRKSKRVRSPSRIAPGLKTEDGSTTCGAPTGCTDCHERNEAGDAFFSATAGTTAGSAPRGAHN